jgi:hypothetical protein
MAGPARVLIVANQTAASPALIDAVRERASRGDCEFTLLVPEISGIPAPDYYTAKTIELALPLLDEAAGSHVHTIIGPADPWHAIERTLDRESFDEAMVSTLPERVSEWLHRDLPSRLEARGIPATIVRARSRAHPPQATRAH